MDATENIWSALVQRVLAKEMYKKETGRTPNLFQCLSIKHITSIMVFIAGWNVIFILKIPL